MSRTLEIDLQHFLICVSTPKEKRTKLTSWPCFDWGHTPRLLLRKKSENGTDEKDTLAILN
jgi:hypothetical protein